MDDLYLFEKVFTNNFSFFIQILADAIVDRLQCDGKPKEEFCSLTSETAAAWLASADGKISHLYNKFMEKFGHRCLREVSLNNEGRNHVINL